MKFLFSMLLLLMTAVRAGEPIFVPEPVMVTEGVYAIVGPLGQRSKENFGLNATYVLFRLAKG